MDNGLHLGGPEIGILCVGGLVALIVVIFFLLTLHRALDRVSPRNRLMEPGMVWLNLIPCVNIVWQFVVYTRVPDSLKAEFRDRGQDDGSDYGKGLGLAVAIINVISLCGTPGARAAGPEAGMMVSCASGLFSLVGLILLIIFWVKIANYSALLARDGGPPPDWRRKLDQFDDDDDRGPTRPAAGPPDDAYKEQDPGRYQ